MTNDRTDWVRLHKALEVEEKNGFTDLMGKQYRFSEFLCLEFGKIPNNLATEWRREWLEKADRFARYANLTVEERQNLITQTRQFLQQIEQGTESEGQRENPTPNPSPSTGRGGRARENLSSPVSQSPPANNRKSKNFSFSAISLEQPLSSLAEVGSRKSQYLARLGLLTVRDLLFYYPRDYIDYSRQVSICDLIAGETVTIVGKIKRCSCFTSQKNKKLTILEILLTDGPDKIKVSRFFAGTRYTNRGWQESIKNRYPVGAVVAASGLVKESKYGLTLDDPQIEVLANPEDSIESINIGRVVPIYPLTEGVPADLVRQAVMAALPAVEQLQDPLPAVLRNQYGLIGLQNAIANIHFPADSAAKDAARRRLVFDEFFYLQLGFLKRRQNLRRTQASAILAPTGQLIEEFHKVLPFKLTNAQQRVINDILNDLQKPEPMNRLIQGDVGSGKTVVGVIAILAAIQSGYQAALMAPTEVLAEQHYRKLVSWFNLLHLPVELLTGSTKTAKRREIHAQLQTGELPLLVGTHALIQDTVNFDQLGLVVIDEQHRFGVHQRAKLQQKGEQPHVLTMTATPIPRTLALTLHGDLDVSQIDELPPGREAINTVALSAKERTQAYDLIRREIAQGRQVYIVLPLVEESEKLDVRSAVEEHQRLSESIFPEFQVGLLHGRMNSAEKDEAINLFRDNQTQILVATTVIEVGVDVPNATVMMIENAERFGLSQLHQLRGRVGRGAAKSYCLLMSSSTTPDARQRLNVLEQSQDGFFISEMDMRFRGPGEVLGTRQSGLPDFALASLVEDQEVLEIARNAAEKIILRDEGLQRWPLLEAELEYRYQKFMSGTILT
ncbi:ATP-dependent DNA helicase RecG [Aerosakkonema funiforme]|uniref:ATP-dependent DNA helicase RecG n=1 Tax=Aerosakkonema funiforme TaxID=1246630 RepID=UPI0035BA28DC